MLVKVSKAHLRTDRDPEVSDFWLNPEKVVCGRKLDLEALRQNGWNVGSLECLYEVYLKDLGEWIDVDSDSFLNLCGCQNCAISTF